MPNPSAAKHAKSQAACCSAVVFQLAQAVFRDERPADRELSAFFRSNRKFGSKDRRFISETLFSLFRWWGWLRCFVDDPSALWQMPAATGAQTDEWLAILLAAHRLDNTALHPAAVHWQRAIEQRYRLPPNVVGLETNGLQKRAAALRNDFGVAVGGWRQLVPQWVAAELDLNARMFERLVRMLQQRPPIWLRARYEDAPGLIDDLTEAGIDAVPCDAVPNAINVQWPHVNLYHLDAFRQGKFEIQDLASQLIGVNTFAVPGQRWWDVCAGAGGKSLQIGSMMENKGTVVATDLREWKLKDLQKRARRARLFNISSRPWQGRSLPVRSESFDGVLVDAPCTCSGTWRRNPDARWTTTPAMIKNRQETQLAILEKAERGVKVGGHLVYATCSLFRSENEMVVRTFLEHHRHFSAAEVCDPLRKRRSVGTCHIWPHEGDSDAVFIARFQKQKSGKLDV